MFKLRNLIVLGAALGLSVAAYADTSTQDNNQKVVVKKQRAKNQGRKNRVGDLGPSITKQFAPLTTTGSIEVRGPSYNGSNLNAVMINPVEGGENINMGDTSTDQGLNTGIQGEKGGGGGGAAAAAAA